MVLLDLNDLVTPGWVPLVLTAILGVACILLVLNMRKQLRKIDVPSDPKRVVSPSFGAPGERNEDA